ncbi:hypothetical protein [Spirosoma arcticum]
MDQRNKVDEPDGKSVRPTPRFSRRTGRWSGIGVGRPEIGLAEVLGGLVE